MGDTALHLAVRANNFDCTEAFIQCSADLSIRNEVNWPSGILHEWNIRIKLKVAGTKQKIKVLGYTKYAVNFYCFIIFCFERVRHGLTLILTSDVTEGHSKCEHMLEKCCTISFRSHVFKGLHLSQALTKTEMELIELLAHFNLVDCIIIFFNELNTLTCK